MSRNGMATSAATVQYTNERTMIIWTVPTTLANLSQPCHTLNDRPRAEPMVEGIIRSWPAFRMCLCLMPSGERHIEGSF